MPETAHAEPSSCAPTKFSTQTRSLSRGALPSMGRRLGARLDASAGFESRGNRGPRHAPLEREHSRAAKSCLCRAGGLFGHREMSAAVLLPARFGVLIAERPFFPVTHRLHAVGSHSQRNQEIFGRLGPAVAQRQVVFG